MSTYSLGLFVGYKVFRVDILVMKGDKDAWI